MANSSAVFTDEEKGIIAQLVAEREGPLEQARLHKKHIEHKLIWHDIYRSFCEITRSTDKSYDQVRERYYNLKKYKVGREMLEEARDMVAAQALIDLASATGREADEIAGAEALLELASGSGLRLP